MARDAPSSVRFEGGQRPATAHPPLSGRDPRPDHDAGKRRSFLGRAPLWTLARRSGTVSWGRGRTCNGCGDRIPRTYSRRAGAARRRPAYRSTGHSRCCLCGCQGLPLLQRSPTDERERTRTGTAPAGPAVGTQAPARASRPTQPGRDRQSGRGRQRCRVLGAVRARQSHGKDLRRAAPRRPAAARCGAEPPAGAQLVRDTPRAHRDRLAGTTAYALEATRALDIIDVAAAMRRSAVVGSSKGLSACRPRLVVLKPQRAAGALDATGTFHEARESQRSLTTSSTAGHRASWPLCRFLTTTTR